MKKCLIIAFSALIANSEAQQITFQKAYASKATLSASQVIMVSHPDSTLAAPSENLTYSLQQTTDGGYIKLSPEKGFSDDLNIRLSKTDSYGRITWEKVFGGSSDDIGKSVRQTADGGYAFTGSTKSFGVGGSDVVLTKTDALGNEQWTKTFGGAGDDNGEELCITADGGYVITGTSKSFGAGDMDIYVMKADTSGELAWAKTYGGSSDDSGSSVIELPGSKLLVLGTTNSFGAGLSDLYLLKIASDGTELWTKAIGGTDAETGVSVRMANDGGFIITGSTLSYGEGAEDLYLVHTNANGDVTWSKTYGGIKTENAYSVKPTADGGYLIAGSTTSYGVESSDLYLVKADSAGNFKWSKAYGADGNDMATAVVSTNDGGFAVIGSTENFVMGKMETYIIKTDASGNTLCNTEITMSATGMAPFAEAAVSASFLSGGSSIANSCSLVCPDSLVAEQLRVICSSEALNVNSASIQPGLDSNLLDTAMAEVNDSVFVTRSFVAAAAAETFNVYPNPGNGSDINVAISSGLGEEMLVIVYDVMGRESYSKVMVMEAEGENVFAIDPQNRLEPGIYLITATSQKSNFSKTLIVK
ncbi:MAG: hypothetical protein JWO09_3697 [Bacteroidetes bacterium]|nr:hypothetical protein [Bacteroidota bacterium]